MLGIFRLLSKGGSLRKISKSKKKLKSKLLFSRQGEMLLSLDNQKPLTRNVKKAPKRRLYSL